MDVKIEEGTALIYDDEIEQALILLEKAKDILDVIKK